MLKVCNHRAGTIYDITIFIQLRPFVVILETTYTRYNLSCLFKKTIDPFDCYIQHLLLAI